MGKEAARLLPTHLLKLQNTKSCPVTDMRMSCSKLNACNPWTLCGRRPPKLYSLFSLLLLVAVLVVLEVCEVVHVAFVEHQRLVGLQRIKQQQQQPGCCLQAARSLHIINLANHQHQHQRCQLASLYEHAYQS